MASPARKRLPRDAKMDSTTEGAYSTSSIRQPNTGKTRAIKDSTDVNDAKAKGSESSVATNLSARLPFPNLRGSTDYVEKEPVHDKRSEDGSVENEADNDADEEDDEDSAPPAKRDKSVRQTILEQDKKYFAKQQAQKDKRDKKTAAATAAAEASGNNITVAQAPARKDPAKKKGTAKTSGSITAATTADGDPEQNEVAAESATDVAAGKKGTTKKPASTTETGKAAKEPTIKNGRLQGKVNASEDTKPRREHRKKDYKYDSAPDLSEKEEGNATIAKLRETVDRHAKWCPFVRFNKKIQNMHRRMKEMEAFAGKQSPSDKDEGGKTKAVKARRPRKAMPKSTESIDIDDHEDSNKDGGKAKKGEDGAEGTGGEEIDEGAEGDSEEEDDDDEEEEEDGDEVVFEDDDEYQGNTKVATASEDDESEIMQSSKSKKAANPKNSTARKTPNKALPAKEKTKAQQEHDSEDDDDMAAYEDPEFTQTELFELATAEAAQTVDDESTLSSLPDDFASDADGISIPDTAFEESFNAHELEEKKRKKGKAKRGSLVADKAALAGKRRAATDEPSAEPSKKKIKTAKFAKGKGAEY